MLGIRTRRILRERKLRLIVIIRICNSREDSWANYTPLDCDLLVHSTISL